MMVQKRTKLPSLAGIASACLWLTGIAGPYISAQASAPPTAKPATGNPARVRTKLDGFDITPKSGKSPNQVGGASRGLGRITLLAPTMCKAYTLTPTFFWGPDDQQSEYIFRLTEASASQNPLYETKVVGGHFIYPESAPALKPGATYAWSVQPAIDMMGGPASASFLLLGGTDRDVVGAALVRAQTSQDPAEAQAKVFMDMRVWFDALTAYSNLIKQYPARAEFHKARADLYDQLPETPETKALGDADAAKAGR
jgi:Domain of Unknown Function (DUF928)